MAKADYTMKGEREHDQANMMKKIRCNRSLVVFMHKSSNSLNPFGFFTAIIKSANRV